LADRRHREGLAARAAEYVRLEHSYGTFRDRLAELYAPFESAVSPLKA
jgi:hypothetical protein